MSFPLVAALAAGTLLIGGAVSADAPGIKGLWQGTLEVGTVRLRVVFKIATKGDGSLAGTLDSLDQGARDIPLSAVSAKEAAVRFEASGIGGVFEGKADKSGTEIAGEWKQGGGVLPLVLKRVEKVAALKRPQVPQRPYPYREEEVTCENPAAGNRLAGTLTLAPGEGPFPAVLLITGSGAQDRDEALLGHRPFLVLADALTRRGIAVLRVDDRGVGGSTGDFQKATSEDFAGDVLAGLAYLKTRKEIDGKKLGLIGHSEGGMIAPAALEVIGDWVAQHSGAR
jgi:dipeptidyl aminopeptidase/acylaminoacyl peptidase